MPAPKSTEQTTEQPAPSYPVIETFVERASRDDVEVLFTQVRDALAGLKGPKAEQAKKALAALERTEELLLHLLDVREQISAEKTPEPTGKRRK
jgi:hypothetical protein